MNHISLMKSTQCEFDNVCNNMDVESLKIWNSKIKDFSSILKLSNLVELEILGFENGSLDLISNLNKLRKLRIIHIPQIEDLSPLSLLSNLLELSLESLPSWDASGKTLLFSNFIPLSKLINLERLELMKVKVKEKGLYPLSTLTNLKELRTDNTFTFSDFAFLSAALPSTKCIYFKPYHEVNYSICKKCSSKKVLLTGVEYNRLVCPKCQIHKINSHASNFENAKKLVST